MGKNEVKVNFLISSHHLQAMCIITKVHQLCFNFSFAVGPKFLRNCEKLFVLVFFVKTFSSTIFSARLQVLFDRFFRGGGFGAVELSKPLSTSDDEQELLSMSVAIQI